MSMELTKVTNDDASDNSRDILLLVGGAALVFFGAGLILSTPVMRRLLGEVNFGNLIGAALPKDLQRYMKMRAM
jgi:hypothetical protein